jgi:hypothetical protein
MYSTENKEVPRFLAILAEGMQTPGAMTANPQSGAGVDPSAVLKARAWPIVAKGMRVSAVVGVLLNLINQGSAFLDGFTDVQWHLVLLNFAVPFGVSVYSSATSLLRAARSEAGAPRGASGG